MISYGVEIECIYNTENLKEGINRQDYHHGGFKEGCCWKLERDGSLNISSNDYKKMRGAQLDCGEFISKRLVGREGLMYAIKELRDNLFGGKPLNECVSFNTSCGTHFHFSIKGKCKKRAHINIFKETRELFFNKLDDSSVLSKRIKTSIKKHYFRDYARELSLQTMKDRRCEFNSISEENQKGMEWRSINLLGVTKWEELIEVFNIVVDCIEFLDRRVRKYNVIENIKIENSDKERILENIKNYETTSYPSVVRLEF